MTPEIRLVTPKKLAGISVEMSLTNNKTGLLWQNFIPLMKKIENRIGTNLYSLQIYNEDYFEKFNPSAIFEKWALAEVSDFEYLPEGLKSFELHGGEYAVFNYTGSAENAPQIFGYIFGTWLPSSGYMLGNRPHFEVLGPKYKQNSSDSEEEIWIPVKTE